MARQSKPRKYKVDVSDIPVNRDGYVPFRHLREIEGGRSARARRTDGRRVAKRVFPKRITPEQAAEWISYPRGCDIECVDAPCGTATEEVKRTQKVRRFPRRKAKSTARGDSWWKKLDWRHHPEEAAREAAGAWESEMSGLPDDARALLDDDSYGEVVGSDRWRHDDREAADVHRRHMLDEWRTRETDMFGSMDRNQRPVRSRSARPPFVDEDGEVDPSQIRTFDDLCLYIQSYDPQYRDALDDPEVRSYFKDYLRYVDWLYNGNVPTFREIAQDGSYAVYLDDVLVRQDPQITEAVFDGAEDEGSYNGDSMGLALLRARKGLQARIRGRRP